MMNSVVFVYLLKVLWKYFFHPWVVAEVFLSGCIEPQQPPPSYRAGRITAETIRWLIDQLFWSLINHCTRFSPKNGEKWWKKSRSFSDCSFCTVRICCFSVINQCKLYILWFWTFKGVTFGFYFKKMNDKNNWQNKWYRKWLWVAALGPYVACEEKVCMNLSTFLSTQSSLIWILADGQ